MKLIELPLGKPFSENIKSIYENSDEDQEYLCEFDGSHYVVEIELLEDPDRAMPANISLKFDDDKTFSDYCLYVDIIRKKECVPVHKLTKLYLIDPT